MSDIKQIRDGVKLSFGQQLSLLVKLAMPAIMAQLSTILMQYIDASMVGRLGADDSASIGLMNSSLWLFWGVCSTLTMGFSVQVAHKLGAKKDAEARAIVRQGILACAIAGSVIALIGVAIAFPLPHWLGGAPQICHNSSIYFLVFASALPILTMNYLGSGMLRCAGNMLAAGLLNVGMCVLDVVFNFLLIFPTHHLDIFGLQISIPGADLGVLGAALGTVLAECCCAAGVMYVLLFRQKELRLFGRKEKGSFIPHKDMLKRAGRISAPMMMQQGFLSLAQIMITVIVAPLGVVAIAANAFAVTAESLCYMPAFGIGDAATTLTGQCLGAKRHYLMKRFCWLSVGLGVFTISCLSVLMYIGADFMMGIMTPVAAIRDLGAEVLRLEAWAEPMYGASIVCYGAFVGVGDTLIPAIMNFGSIWVVRIPLAAIMAPIFGLRGVWLAMVIELSFRGLIFLWRMFSGAWYRRARRQEV